MWWHHIDLAREASVQPREVLVAVNEGRIGGRTIKGTVFVRSDEVATLARSHVDWFTLLALADLTGTYYKNIRNQMADGVLDSVDDGPRRRWVLSAEVGVSNQN